MRTFIPFLIFYFFFSCQKKQSINTSTILVDTQTRSITFYARLNTSSYNFKEQKFFLFYFEGYPWLKNFCVFESSSSLRELQTAVASIDWKLWDNIYINNFSPKIDVYISTDSINWQNIKDYIKTQKYPSRQTIFWGNHLYDESVLFNYYTNNRCSTCHFLPLEKDIFLSCLDEIKIISIQNIDSEKYYLFKIVFN